MLNILGTILLVAYVVALVLYWKYWHYNYICTAPSAEVARQIAEEADIKKALFIRHLKNLAKITGAFVGIILLLVGLVSLVVLAISV